MKRSVQIKWTQPAYERLKKLPKKIQRIILEKTRSLGDVENPRLVHKPLTGLLTGYYSIKVSRYRVIFTVKEEKKKNGEIVHRITVIIVAVGKRESKSRKDIYNLAKRLIDLAKNDENDGE